MGLMIGILALILLVVVIAVIVVVAVSASAITGLTSTEIFALRNPVRIFLLFITKAMLVFALSLFSSFFRKKKLLFHPIQCISMVFIFFITFITTAVFFAIYLVLNWKSAVPVSIKY